MLLFLHLATILGALGAVRLVVAGATSPIVVIAVEIGLACGWMQRALGLRPIAVRHAGL